MKIFHSKAELINNISNKDLVFPVWYFNNQFVHKFTSIPINTKIFSSIQNLSFDGKYYVNEIILNGVKRKPYLDLEITYPTEKELNSNFKKIIKKLQTDIIKVFSEQYGVSIKKSDILLLNSSGKVKEGYKLSLHIIVSPKNKTYYYINSKYTDSSSYHFYTSLINLDSFYESLLDAQVYNADVNFRIIGSHKNKDDNRILNPIDSLTFEEIHLKNIDKLDYLLTYLDESKESCQLKTPIIKQTINSTTKIIKNNPNRTDLNPYITKLVKKFH